MQPPVAEHKKIRCRNTISSHKMENIVTKTTDIEITPLTQEIYLKNSYFKVSN